MAIYQTFKLDNTGDIAIESGRLVIVSDVQAIKTQLQVRLNLVKGNWFLDLNEGLDYFGSILGKKQVDIELTSQFKRAILSTQGIDKLISFSAVFGDNRQLEVTFKAITVFGMPITDADIRLTI